MGRPVSCVNGRCKGSRGELTAAVVLTKVTGIPWIRTAQRWGKSKADLEPMELKVPLHVEVKFWAASLTWWVKNCRKSRLCLSQDGFLFAFAEHLPAIIEQTVLPNEGLTKRDRTPPSSALATEAFEQAMRDRDPAHVPLLMLKQNGDPWIVAWHEAHDDQLCEILRGLRA